MGKEIIGSVTEWELGSDADWAYEMAIQFLYAALGDPPPGVSIDVALSDHDLGYYAALVVRWQDNSGEPSAFIRRAGEALSVFSESIDWSRIRPSLFFVEAEEE